MKSKLVGCLFSALMLTCFQQGTAQTTYNGSVSKSQGQQMNQMGAAPKCDSQGNWDMWADFLWWSANFNTPTNVDTSFSDSETNIKIKRPGSQWDPGVRVGLGWNTGYDNWDVQGFWTYFYNSATQDHSKVSFRYNVADYEMGKAYYVSRHFMIRPFTGIHAIWTSLNYRTSSDINIFSVINSVSTVFSGTTRTELSSWGVGPRMGFNSNWGDYRGFSLLANISGSLLYGKELAKADIDAPGVDYDIRDRDHWQLMPTMQLQFGLSYACCFGGGQNQFRISAAWESNFIWEAANVLYYDRPISMQGLTVDLRFDF